MGGACLRCGEADCTNICSGCTMVLYCSRECQKADWKSHKPHCVKPREGEWSADQPGLRVAPNARPDEVVALLARPRFGCLAALDPNDPTHKVGHSVYRVMEGEASFEDVRAQLQADLARGANPFLALALVKTPADVAKAEAAWGKRKPGMTGLMAAVKASKATFISSPVLGAAGHAQVPLLSLLLAHCQPEVLAAGINSYCAITGKSEDTVHVGSLIAAALLGGSTSAAYAARPAILELLLKAGADPRLPVLMETEGDYSAVPPVFTAYRPRGFSVPSLLKEARECGQACMRLLVQHGADINATRSNGNTVLTDLIFNLSSISTPTAAALTVSALQTALELGADPNLRAAAPARPLRPLDVLAGEASVHTADDNALLFAQAAAALHKHGADFRPLPHYMNAVNGGDMGCSYLWFLATNHPCAFEVLKFAIEVAGVSPDAIAHPTLKAPLIVACCLHGNIPAIRLLMAHGVDSTVTDTRGMHALGQLMIMSFEREKGVASGLCGPAPAVAHMPSQSEFKTIVNDLLRYEMRWRAEKGMRPLMEQLEGEATEGESRVSVQLTPEASAGLRRQEDRIRAKVAEEEAAP